MTFEAKEQQGKKRDELYPDSCGDRCQGPMTYRCSFVYLGVFNCNVRIYKMAFWGWTESGEGHVGWRHKHTTYVIKYVIVQPVRIPDSERSACT